jgi:iron complex outermembrane receptor protein
LHAAIRVRCDGYVRNLFQSTKVHRVFVFRGRLAASAIGLRAQQVAADSRVVRLEEFEVNERQASALTLAVTESRLDAVQPQSIISLPTIQNSIAPTADYAMIAALAPSVTNFSLNGPGLNESKPTLRGFADGQYNVTIDGIPFGDGNDYTHHTTSYFPAKLLGRVTVDRGPGTASTIGMATFGGTIAMETKDPRTEASFVPTLSYGSWKTELAHFEFNTGLLPQAHNGSLIASYQYMTSDGYRTFGTLRRNTYFFKYIQPIGPRTTLTFMGEYNNIKFNNPNASPLTGLQILTLGRNFGQTNNPLDRNGDYYGSNYQVKQTDTSWIGLNSDLGNGWKLDDKIYTFSYNNSSHESPGTNGGSTRNPTGKDHDRHGSQRPVQGELGALGGHVCGPLARRRHGHVQDRRVVRLPARPALQVRARLQRRERRAPSG